MIGALEGKIIRIQADRCWLYVNGVAYIITIGASLAAQLVIDQEIFMWIATTVHDGQTSYFGFQNPEAEVWFYQLIAVSGVGGKVAMAILSALPPDSLALAVVNQESACLRAVDGVGPKLVARLLTELKAFAQKWSLEHRASWSAGPQSHGVTHERHSLLDHHVRLDAVQALVALGYRRIDVDKVMGQLLDSVTRDAAHGPWSAPALVTKALALLANMPSE